MFTNLIRRGVTGIAVLAFAGAALGQTTYFSIEGDLPSNQPEDTYDFYFDLNRSVGSPEVLIFRTFGSSTGSVNAAGDPMPSYSPPPGGFEGFLELFDSAGNSRGYNNDSGPGADAKLTWSQSIGRPLHPNPLPADSYRLNTSDVWGGTVAGHPVYFFVDLVGPSDAFIFTGGSPVNTAVMWSVKFGSNDGGTALFNHSSDTFYVDGPMVVANTGDAELNLSGGTVTIDGLTTVNASGTLTHTGGTYNANGGMLIDGGTVNRNADSFSLATGQTMTIQNGGSFDSTTPALYTLPDSVQIDVIGNGSLFSHQDDGGDFTVSVDGGAIVNVAAGGDLVSDYFWVKDGQALIDGAGSTLQVNTGTQAVGGFDHRIGSDVFGPSSGGKLTFSNEATGTFASAAPTTLVIADDVPGELNVYSAAQIEVQNLNLASAGVGAATVNVGGSGSEIAVLDGFTTTIGAAAGSTATMNLTDSGLFIAGNGATTTINATGTVNIDDNAQLLTFGDVDIVGGTLNLAGTGRFDAYDDVTIDGGQLLRSGGTFDLNFQNTLTVQNAGLFDYGPGIFNSDPDTAIVIKDGGEFNTGTGTATFNATTSVDVTNSSAFNAVGDLLINGATMTVDSTSIFNPYGDVTVNGGSLSTPLPGAGVSWSAPGKHVTVRNGGQFVSNGGLTLRNTHTVMIESGADMIHTGVGSIGSVGATAASLTVDGAGSTFDQSGGGFAVSQQGGVGAFTIQNGATASVNNLLVADVLPTTNSDGSVNILTGGSLSTGGAIRLGENNGDAGIGTINIDGAGSTLSQSGNAGIILGNADSPGNGGVHTINVTEAGFLNAGTIIINNTGTLNINSGGIYNTDANLDINGGHFELDGGTAYVNNFTMLAGGTFDFFDGKLGVVGGVFSPNTTDFTIDGHSAAEFPTLDLVVGSTVSGLTGLLRVGESHRGRFELRLGSTLDVSAIDLGNLAGSEGEALVDGAGSALTTTSDFVVGEGGTGDLVVSNGGAVHAGDDVAIGRQGSASGTTLVTSGGSITAVEGLWVGEDGDGSLEIGPDSSVSAEFMNIGLAASKSGSVTVDGDGALLSVDETLRLHTSGATLNLNAGTLRSDTIDNTLGGTFNFTGGTLSVANFNGTLTQQGGTLAAGASAGVTNITGDYEIVSGALEVELGGVTQGAEYDFYNVTGEANLSGGTLDLSYIDVFTATPGQSFMILSAGTLTGEFETVNFPAGEGWTIEYDTNAGTVTVAILRGDCDADGQVNLIDYADLEACLLGPDGGLAAGCECFDFDADDDVDTLDFAEFQVNFTGS